VTRWYLVAAAGRAGLHAVRRLHAAVCRQHGPCAHRRADPGCPASRSDFPTPRFVISSGSGLRWVVGRGVSRTGLEIVPVVVRRRRAESCWPRSRAAAGRRWRPAAIRSPTAPKSAADRRHGLRQSSAPSSAMMTQTGVGTIFGGWIIGLGAKSLFLALIMTMLLSILLGTGIPDHSDLHHHRSTGPHRRSPNSACPLIASHMFCVLLRHHGRSFAAGGAGGAGGGSNRQGKIPTRSVGKQCALRWRAMSFRSSSSTRRPLMLQAGDPMAAQLGFLRLGGAGNLQGAGRDRPVRRSSRSASCLRD